MKKILRLNLIDIQIKLEGLTQARILCQEEYLEGDPGHREVLKWTRGEGKYPTDELATEKVIISRALIYPTEPSRPKSRRCTAKHEKE